MSNTWNTDLEPPDNVNKEKNGIYVNLNIEVI